MQEGHDLCKRCKTKPVYSNLGRKVTWCSECLIDTMDDVECRFCEKPVAAWFGTETRADDICCVNCVMLLSLDAAKRRLTREEQDPGVVEKRTREIERATEHFQPKKTRKQGD